MRQTDALKILKTGANVFLTGEPGSGKTHTVNSFVRWLREQGIEPAITASTGIAATHIGGYTIHSWSGIGIKPRLTEYDLDHMGTNERLVKRVGNARTLIIDEVSMLSGDTLTMVDQACRALRNSEEPFGGLQVVLVGDFFQLPPVVSRTQSWGNTEDLFGTESGEDKRFAFRSPSWDVSNFVVAYLSEQHRQEDKAFLEILGAIRRGEVSEDHHEILKTRFDAVEQKDIPRLFSHNADVDVLNSRELDKIAINTREFHMESRGSDKLVAQLKKGCLSPEKLELKVGARVMFTKNNFEEGFVNGTLGKVVGFSEFTGNPEVRTESGKLIEVEPLEWAIEENNRVLASIKQIPLRLAWAITIHKSQGMSLDAAQMDLSQTFEYGQGYVALSRVRTLSGLKLSGINQRALEVHPDIQAVDARFRGMSLAAEESFNKLSADEITEMHDNFVRACGGKKKETRLHTRLRTGEARNKRQDTKGKSEDESEESPLDKIRKKNPNAYRKWSDEDDQILKLRFNEGASIKTLMKEFGRQKGGITARLVKLGLIEDPKS
ncbi:MAG: AAA family ATPase [Candidatus Zambryskibacteria bacterium]|nr:AAA family ATPase [Candidatus Zambryskibacteria bacterium]